MSCHVTPCSVFCFLCVVFCTFFRSSRRLSVSESLISYLSALSSLPCTSVRIGRLFTVTLFFVCCFPLSIAVVSSLSQCVVQFLRACGLIVAPTRRGVMRMNCSLIWTFFVVVVLLLYQRAVMSRRGGSRGGRGRGRRRGGRGRFMDPPVEEGEDWVDEGNNNVRFLWGKTREPDGPEIKGMINDPSLNWTTQFLTSYVACLHHHHHSPPLLSVLSCAQHTLLRRALLYPIPGRQQNERLRLSPSTKTIIYRPHNTTAIMCQT